MAATVHFIETEFEDFLNAPRQGHEDIDALESAVLLEHAGVVFDLRCDQPAVQRLAALAELHGSAIQAGVILPLFVVCLLGAAPHFEWAPHAVVAEDGRGLWCRR